MLTTATAKRSRRTSYSLELKLLAIDETDKLGLKTACLNLGLDEKVVRQWHGRADALRQAGLTNDGSSRRLRPRSSNGQV